MLPHPVPLSEPSSPMHSYPSSDPDDNKYGNYYETMASDIPNGNAEMTPPFTPGTGKSMGSFFPAERRFQFPVTNAPPPPPPPVTLPVPAQNKDINPYQAPWDASMLQGPNRMKKNDLAYATSDEIQVLIQRMEHDRRNLNEGASAAPAPTPLKSYSYIHIDDYKIKTPIEKKDSNQVAIAEEKDELYVYENDTDSEDDDDDGGEADNESDDNNENCAVQGATLGSQGTNDGTPRSNDNFCGSEDTGYRSVGSPEHVLVCEDDYLVPGSVKSAVSVNSKGTSSTIKDRGSVASSSYGEVYDALKEGESVDVKTKF